MKAWLLLVVLTGSLALAADGKAQYVYLDANGDGVCDASDFTTSSTTSVDIYFDTNHNRDGSTVTCPDGPPSTLDIFSYGFCLRASGTGSVTYGSYSDAMAAQVPGGFGTQVANVKGGPDAYIAFGGTIAAPPGRYRVGTYAITITGAPYLTFAEASSVDPGALTLFGTECPGENFDGSQILGRDFMDNCGTGFVSPVRQTTWGAIKSAYR